MLNHGSQLLENHGSDLSLGHFYLKTNTMGRQGRVPNLCKIAAELWK